MTAQDIIEVSRELAASGKGRPKQAFLRRSISTAYYALFHALAGSCADMFIGGASADQSGTAWRRVYRSLNHAHTKNQCNSRRISEFPKEIQDFASLFAIMQVKRHKADYDPSEKFQKSKVLLDIDEVQAMQEGFAAVPARERRAFAAYVLMKSRRD